MKSILTTLMMLVMLTPGLACAKTMCANMDAMAAQAEEMPCHGDMAEMDSEPGVGTTVSLVLPGKRLEIIRDEPVSATSAA